MRVVIFKAGMFADCLSSDLTNDNLHCRNRINKSGIPQDSAGLLCDNSTWGGGIF